jgi:hypothetical protein
MSRDLSPAWELLSVVTRARQHLATARPAIWEKARLPTAERTQIVRSTAAGGDQIVMRVALETHLGDGRLVTSCLDIVASPRRWRVQPYITLDNGTEWLVWEGAATERDDSTAFAQAVDSATRSLLSETMNVDFKALPGGAEPGQEADAEPEAVAEAAAEPTAETAARAEAGPELEAAAEAAPAVEEEAEAESTAIDVSPDERTAIPVSSDEPTAVPVSTGEAEADPIASRQE